MTSLLVPWLVLPLVLGALCLGAGLLLEAIAGIRVANALLLPLGFAVLSVVTLFPALTGATATLVAPAAVAVAVAGFGLTRQAPWPRLDGVALLAAVGVYAVYAAPIVLSGSATLAGYIRLDDDSTYFAMLGHVLEHGREIGPMPPSTYEATLDTSLAYGYPMGSLLPLGVGHVLVGTDLAWLFQPYLTFAAALLALALNHLLAPLVPRARLRAVLAFVAAQPAILYGYVLWGGVKEIVAAALLAVCAAVLPALMHGSRRSLILPAVAAAALVGCLSLAGVVWLIPFAVAALGLAMRSGGVGAAISRVAAAGALAAALALPTLIAALEWLPRTGGFRSDDELANLRRPLRVAQALGIWPTGDFRGDPDDLASAAALMALAAVAAVAGVVLAVRRRQVVLPVYVLSAVVGAAGFLLAASPWIEAKALATASPAVLTAALATAGLLVAGGRRVEGVAVAVAIAGGVLWSNVLAYRDVMLAPHDQFAELERIGRDFTGRGPALLTAYEPYAARHFLRKLDPEGASELRRRRVPLVDGSLLPKGASADIDAFRRDAVAPYALLVLRRTPLGSHPGSEFRLVRRGRYYDVWERDSAPATVARHLGLGQGRQPSATTSCDDVRRIAVTAGPAGRVAAVVREPAPVAELLRGSLPPAWLARGGPGGEVVPRGAGAARTTVHVDRAGRYRVWLAGSTRGAVSVVVGGRPAGSIRHRINNDGPLYEPLGTVELARGDHDVVVDYGGPDAHPGSADAELGLGPVVLERVGRREQVVVLPAGDAPRLCGRRLDWVQALR
jgi:hypothetical protein